MTILLLICCYIFLTTVSFGLLAVKLAGRVWHLDDPSSLFSADILSVIGLVGIGTILHYYSIFFKIGGIVPHVIISTVAIVTIVLAHDDWKKLISAGGNGRELARNSLVVLPVILSILFYAVRFPRVTDIGYYYAQSIQWVEKYRCVPGLGNLSAPLAYNSASYVLSAFYGFSFLTGQTVYSLNAYLGVLFASSILISITKCMRSEKRGLSIMFAFLFFAYYSIFEIMIASPSPDLLVAIMVFYLFLLVEQISEPSFRVKALMAIAFIASFLLTIKLSQSPALLFVLYLFLDRGSSSRKRMSMALVIPAVVLLPWLIRNVILSGYLFYPLAGIDVFSFDWKIPSTSVVALKDVVVSFVRIPTKPAAEVLRLSLVEWFPFWFIRLSGFYKFLFAICLFSPFLVAAAWIMNNSVRKELILFWFVCFVGIVFCFVTAPDIRYVWGSFLFCAAIPVSLFADRLSVIRPRSLSGAMLVLFVLFGVFHAILPQMRTHPDQLVARLWRPEPLPQPDVVERKARNLVVSVPTEGKLCYNAPVPCTPDVNPDLEMRGNDAEDGFRIASR